MPPGNPHDSRTSDPTTLRPSRQKLPRPKEPRGPQPPAAEARKLRFALPASSAGRAPQRRRKPSGTGWRPSPTETYPADPDRTPCRPQHLRPCKRNVPRPHGRGTQHLAAGSTKRAAYLSAPASGARVSPRSAARRSISAWAASYSLGITPSSMAFLIASLMSPMARQGGIP